MKIKLNPWVRFAIACAVAAFYILTMVYGVYDGLINAFAPFMYLLAMIYGAIGAAVTYGVLPTKEAIKETKYQLNNGTNSSRDKAIGYWKWLACWAVGFAIWVALYINEM